METTTARRAAEKKKSMIRVDGYYLYELGCSLHPLYEKIKVDARIQDVVFDLYHAQGMLGGFLNHSVYTEALKTPRKSGQELLAAISTLIDNQERSEPINNFEVYHLTKKLSEFETILRAELGLFPTYLVIKKRGYDISDLIDNGWIVFPAELSRKVPEALDDINAGTRCIAFELNTAAGFHLHRANESVLHKYYDIVTNGAPRPEGRNIGDYLRELDNRNVGESKVKSCLKDLKNLHRNPLIHPEDSIDTVDEALALLGIIQSAMVHMLKVIPEPIKDETGVS